jgi:hypothetical protein
MISAGLGTKKTALPNGSRNLPEQRFGKCLILIYTGAGSGRVTSGIFPFLFIF